MAPKTENFNNGKGTFCTNGAIISYNPIPTAANFQQDRLHICVYYNLKTIGIDIGVTVKH